MEIKGSVIAITGGGRGLGLAMAKHFAERGASLALIDVNESDLQAAAAQLHGLGADARCYLADVTKEVSVETTFSTIARDFGKLNGLINNAGILHDGMLLKAKDGKVNHKMSLAQFQSVIDVNLVGGFLCGREAAIQMIETKSQGVIINISSVSRAGNMGQSNYSASKAGMASMTVTWARELGRHGIRVGAIAPGVVATDMTAQMKPEAMERMAQMVPLSRLGEAAEIAHSAGYIFENDYFTGRIIEIDGGLRI